MAEGFDLSQPIYGTVSYNNGTLELNTGERINLILSTSGEKPSEVTIEIEDIALHALGVHLEEFRGTDVTDPSTDRVLAPGKKIAGIKNLNFALVFLTEVDGKPIPQIEEFYDTSDNNSGMQ